MRKVLFAILYPCLFFACTPTKKINKPVGYSEIVQEGIINCFDAEIIDEKNKPINCEASAVFLSNNSLIIAEDKEINRAKLSPVFSIPLTDKFPATILAGSVTYLTSESFINVRKIEDMTKEPFGELCFATTDFEWITDKPSEADAYNSILCWKDGDYNSMKYIDETIDGGIKSSKKLRRFFLKALVSADYPGGPPYYKVEGLCALPDSTLLFGIREIGKSYEHPEYKFIVLSTKYHVINDQVTLDSNFKKCYELDARKIVGLDVGLSGIAYNKFQKEIYFSSSLEDASDAGAGFSAWLWRIPLTEFYKNQPAELLKDKAGKILKLNHKIEGITFISDDTMFAVSDQDRVLNSISATGSILTRKTFQAIFSIIKVR